MSAGGFYAQQILFPPRQIEHFPSTMLSAPGGRAKSSSFGGSARGPSLVSSAAVVEGAKFGPIQTVDPGILDLDYGSSESDRDRGGGGEPPDYATVGGGPAGASEIGALQIRIEDLLGAIEEANRGTRFAHVQLVAMGKTVNGSIRILFCRKFLAFLYRSQSQHFVLNLSISSGAAAGECPVFAPSGEAGSRLWSCSC